MRSRHCLRNAYSVVKFVAKWKRLARRTRERKAAELAASRAADPQSNAETAAGGASSQNHQMTSVIQPDPSTAASSTGRRRLGPLKLGVLRRPSNFLGGGTLSARPKSGVRRPIEKEKNSLPPLHSARAHPALGKIAGNTSLDDHDLPNGGGK